MATPKTYPQVYRLSIQQPVPPAQFLTDLVFSHYKLEPKQGAGAGAASSGNFIPEGGPDRASVEE